MEKPSLRVTVVGAGFSGLVSAFYLSRAGFDVDIVEKSGRAGGLIQTHREGFGLVETAANGLLNSARVEELFQELGLEVTPTLREARRRYIFVDGRARRWPIGLAASLRVACFVLRKWLGLRSIEPREFETVKAWADRVLGVEAGAKLVEPALQGIYAGDARRMSATAVFGWLFKLRAKRPRIRGTVAPRAGMGQLIQRLTFDLEKRGVRIRYGARLEPSSHPIVIATSVSGARELLKELDPARAELLAKIEVLPLVSVSAAFSKPPPVQGFGCLIAPSEGRKALGVLLNGCIFPERGRSETWILGGAANRAILEKSDAELLAIISEERRAVLGAEASAVEGHRITRWPEALPHYTVDLERVLSQLQGMRNGVILIGNYLGDIGLARILERAARLPEEIKRAE